MLRLKDVIKDYSSASGVVRALNGVNLNFRKKEFVAVLGPSGCGKTTLLNVIGGLDRYSQGDFTVNGINASDFSEETWDAYRNSTVGFVFQSYNLIPHLSILENVEMTLKLSGYEKSKCEKLALDALKKVSMDAERNKKPSELSGGQMQRVAIARALVNNPSIILADEPTGALDSKLSEQIMSVLKEVAQERLVVMVTHNAPLAEKYATRIIEMQDGVIIKDTDCYEPTPDVVKKDAPTADEPQTPKKKQGFFAKLFSKFKKKKQTTAFGSSYLSKKTALSLSFKNLITKKRRTTLTSIAGSVGIIGLGLVLAFSNGINLFLTKMENSLLSSIPVGIYEYSMDYSVLMDIFMNFGDTLLEEGDYPDDDVVDFVPANQGSGIMGELVEQIIDSVKENDVSEEFIEYLDKMDSSWYDAVYKYLGVQMNLIAKDGDEYIDVSPTEVTTTVINIATNVLGEKGLEKTNWNQLVGDSEFMSKYYDLMAGEWPTSKNDLVVVVNERNEIEIDALTNFGFDVTSADKNDDGKVTFDELLTRSSGFTMQMVTNDAYYEKTAQTVKNYPTVSIYDKKELTQEAYDSENAVELSIVGVLRVKENSPVKAVGANLCYTTELAEYALLTAKNSEITAEQKKLLQLSGYDENSSSALTVLKGKTSVQDRYVNSSVVGLLTASLEKTSFMKSFGIDVAPVYINVYATDLDGKDKITDYIDAWGENGKGNVAYFDVTEMFMYNVNTITDICVYALLIVASISLIVSCIMIGIITGNSVTERTREIGILRSMGARQKDIIAVFLSETVIIGIFSGIIGTLLTYALAPLFSLVAKSLCSIPNLAVANPLHSLALFVLSVVLALVSGLIPAIKASKKNVVDALRIE